MSGGSCMFCQKCGQKNDAHAQFCSSCGNQLGRAEKRRKWLYVGIFMTLAVLIGVGYGAYKFLPFGEFKGQKADAPIENPQQITQTEMKNPQQVKNSKIEKGKIAVINESMPKVFTIFTEASLGSGFLYEQGGYIITNAHVVAGYTNVIIRNSDGEDSPGKVIGISDYYDVALIRAGDYKNAKPLGIEQKASEVGTEVIAIGSPQGFENTATIGYLTGTGRDIEHEFTYENIYQIDAQIDQGSSGGPLLDAKTGKVIGINSLLYTGNTSFGFSIPMYSMTELVNGWIQSPMSEQQVASMFGAYDDYVYYDEEIQDEFRSYYEDYDWEDDYWEYESDDYETDWEFYEEEVYEEVSYFDAEELADFVISFRANYEQALHEGTYGWIEDMVNPGSTAHRELEQYIAEIAGMDVTFTFLDNVVTSIIDEGDYAVVSTYETFEIMSEDGEITYYEREKAYTIVMNAHEQYQITAITTK